MLNLYNGKKLHEFMNTNNLGKKDLAEELSVNPARIDELCRGKELLPILNRLCDKYNIPISNFYGDFIEPDYMTQVRRKISEAENYGLNVAEIAKCAGVNKNVIRDIINHPTFCCSDNIANKIIQANIK